MKIHIVQKGDTLWELSKKYGVDFEELKAMNSQLSSPDMIMPGMKIKIPGDAKTVKKEKVAVKEVKKEEVKKPYVDTSPKPMPVIKEDDTKLHQVVKPEMPVPSLPQMPIMDQDINQYTTINFPQMPYMKTPEAKPAKPEVKPAKQEVKKEVKEEVKQPKPIQQPIMEPVQQPVMEPMHQPVMEPMHHPMPMYHHPMQPCCPPMIPIYIHPCCPPPPCHHGAHHHAGFAAPQFMPPHHGGHQVAGMGDCGCGSRELVAYNPASENANSTGEQLNQVQPLSSGQMYPPQFERLQTDSTTYPKPPMFPQFTATNNKHSEAKNHE